MAMFVAQGILGNNSLQQYIQHPTDNLFRPIDSFLQQLYLLSPLSVYEILQLIFIFKLQSYKTKRYSRAQVTTL